jgi:MFS family permease
LLWTGQAISLVGDAAFFVAVGWRAFSLSGSGALGVVLMLQALGMVVTLLVGGALADRYSRRKLMITSDVARGLIVGGLVAAETTGSMSIELLAGVGLLMGLASGFFAPAFGGLVPLVVEQPQLASANALIGISRQGALVLGPAIAGLLYGAVGPGAVFALDAVSFAVSTGFVWLARPRAYERDEAAGPLREIGQGLRYVASERWLWVTISLFSVFLMVVLAPVQVLMPALIQEHFGKGVSAYGLLLTFQGVGMVGGTLAFGQLNPRHRRGVLSYRLWALNSLLVLALALSPWYAMASGIAVIRGALVGFGIGIWDTMLMERVPEGLLARVISVDYFGSIGLMPVGLVLAGAVSDVASPQAIIAAGAAVCAILFAAFLRSPWLRAVD